MADKASAEEWVRQLWRGLEGEARMTMRRVLAESKAIKACDEVVVGTTEELDEEVRKRGEQFLGGRYAQGAVLFVNVADAVKAMEVRREWYKTGALSKEDREVNSGLTETLDKATEGLCGGLAITLDKVRGDRKLWVGVSFIIGHGKEEEVTLFMAVWVGSKDGREWPMPAVSVNEEDHARMREQLTFETLRALGGAEGLRRRGVFGAEDEVEVVDRRTVEKEVQMRQRYDIGAMLFERSSEAVDDMTLRRPVEADWKREAFDKMLAENVAVMCAQVAADVEREFGNEEKRARRATVGIEVGQQGMDMVVVYMTTWVEWKAQDGGASGKEVCVV